MEIRGGGGGGGGGEDRGRVHREGGPNGGGKKINHETSGGWNWPGENQKYDAHDGTGNSNGPVVCRGKEV